MMAFDSAQIHGRPISRLHRLHIFPVGLQSSDLGFHIAWYDFQPVAYFCTTAADGSCNDRSKPFHREDAIYRLPKETSIISLNSFTGKVGQYVPEILNSFAGLSRGSDDWNTILECVLHKIANLFLQKLEPFIALGKVTFRDSNAAQPDIQEPEDVEMLPRLRHDAVIGCNGE